MRAARQSRPREGQRIITHEERRLEEAQHRSAHWKRWGPYLSERAWGTVREDYSPGGTAWDYFPHDHARSRARSDRLPALGCRRRRAPTLPRPRRGYRGIRPWPPNATRPS